MKILIVYNVAKQLVRGIPDDLVCEEEIELIVPAIDMALRKKGHFVQTLETTYNFWQDIQRYQQEIDVVVNLAENFGGTNDNEFIVPAILDTLQFCYTGANAANMLLTQDKHKSKIFFKYAGIPTPNWVKINKNEEIDTTDITFPAIIKPITEEASIGITKKSVVTDKSALIQQALYVFDTYKESIIIEKFIQGREISVGVWGNDILKALYPVEFLFPSTMNPYERIRSYEYKWGGEKEIMVKPELSGEIIAKLSEYAILAHRVLDCRHYSRSDFRIDGSGNIFCLETNYNPGIGPNTDGLNNTFTRAAEYSNISFEDMIESLIEMAIHERNK